MFKCLQETRVNNDEIEYCIRGFAENCEPLFYLQQTPYKKQVLNSSGNISICTFAHNFFVVIIAVPDLICCFGVFSGLP